MRPSVAKSQDGFVLMATLLITAVLVAVVVEFAYNVFISTARALNFTESQRAGLIATNGVEIARKALDELVKRNANLTMGPEGITFTKTDGEHTLEIRAVDELSKLSTRIVYAATGVPNTLVGSSYRALLKELKLDEQLMDPLADWIDADDEPHIYGAEGLDYYRALKKPYSPKNGYLDTLEEMLMIKDYTPEVFNKLKPFVTVYNEQGLININTASKTALMALSDEMTDTLAQNLIDARRVVPFKDKSDVMKVSGFETLGFELQNRIRVESGLFRVFARATTGDAVSEVEAVVDIKGSVLYWRQH